MAAMSCFEHQALRAGEKNGTSRQFDLAGAAGLQGQVHFVKDRWRPKSGHHGYVNTHKNPDLSVSLYASSQILMILVNQHSRDNS